MAIIDLSMVVSAIVEMGVEGAWKGASRSETVIRVFRKVGLSSSSLPDDFNGLYAHALIEYGVGKPKAVVEFFRHEIIRDAFRQSFEKRNPSILDREAESLIEWHAIGEEFRRMDIDPRREFARLTALFHVLADRSRSIPEMKRDHSIADIHESMQVMISRTESLSELSKIRDLIAEIRRDLQLNRLGLPVRFPGSQGPDPQWAVLGSDDRLPQIGSYEDELFRLSAGTEGGIRVINRIVSTDGFVGRRELQRMFRLSLQALDRGEEIFKRVFLLHGEGGMGKTAALQRLREILNQDGPEFNLVAVDWENHKGISGSTDMMDVLYEELARLYPNEMIGYVHRRNEVSDMLRRVESLKRHYFEHPGRNLPSGIHPFATISQSDVTSIGRALDRLRHIRETDLRACEEWLKTQLTPREKALYEHRRGQEALSVALLNALIEAGKKQPLVIMMDTYEVVDKLAGPWVRNGLIYYSLDRSPRLMFVIAGRRSLSKEYNEVIPEEFIHGEELDRFGQLDIEDYLEARALPTESEYVRLIFDVTLGIPLGVEMIGNALLGARKGIHDIRLAFGDVVGKSQTEIVSALAERFLKHCVNAQSEDLRADASRELDHILTLALLHSYGNQVEMERALGHIWNELYGTRLTASSVGQVLLDLRYRFSFIFSGEGGQMHPEVRKCIRAALRTDRWRFGGSVSDINDAARGFFATKLKIIEQTTFERDTKLDEYQFFMDPDWQKCKLHCLNHSFWLDENEAMREIVNSIMLADLYAPAFRNDLMNLVEDKDLFDSLKPLHKLVLTALREGLSDLSGFSDDARRQITGFLSETLDRSATIARLLAESKRAEKQGNLDKASRKLIKAEELCSDLEMATERAERFVNLARRFYARNEPYTAANLVTRAIDLDRDNKYAFVLLGDIFCRKEEYENALDNYEKALSIDSDFKLAQEKSEQIKQIIGILTDHPGSVLRFDRVTLSKLVMIKGYRLAAKGAIGAAAELFKNAVELNPANVEARIKLGNVLRQLGSLDQAIGVFRAIPWNDLPEIERQFYGSRVMAGEGAVRYLRGDYERSAYAYAEAINYRSDYANARAGLGKAYMQLGQYNNAQKEVRLALELNPLAYWILTDLALIQLLLGEQDQAAQSFGESLNICRTVQRNRRSRLYQVLYVSAMDHFGLGNRTEGESALRRGIDECAAPGLVMHVIQDLKVIEKVSHPLMSVKETIGWLWQQIP